MKHEDANFTGPSPVDEDYPATAKDYSERDPEDGTVVLTSSERKAILSPDLIIKTLKIKPGMKILDLGLGKGTFTLPMAEALKNTGHVFATDVDPRMVRYIKEEIKKTQYKNITPILIRNNTGIAPFYKKQVFDVIFICETLPYLHNFVAYFNALRSSLARKTGRLFIINFKNVSDFHEVDFGDFKGVIKILEMKGNTFPVFARLEKEVRKFVKKRFDNVPPAIKNKIVSNFNKMLLDRTLLNDLKEYFVLDGFVPAGVEWPKPFIDTIQPGEIALFKWLFVHLDGTGVFDRREKLTSAEKEQLQQLNKIILSGIFRLYTTSIMKGEFQPPIFLEENSVAAKMKEAGYNLIKEHKVLSQYYFLEFKRKI